MRQIEPSGGRSGAQRSDARKRTTKACDRCRIKKSKCNGKSPCGRCSDDDTICVFSKRTRSHNKVYPQGHIEMLESHQVQLVKGLQELYRRLIRGKGWPGAPLATSITGNPLTHEVLERLGVLQQATQNNNGCHSDDDSIQTEFDDVYADYIKSSDGFTSVTSTMSDPLWQHNGSKDLASSEQITRPPTGPSLSFPVLDTAFTDYDTSAQQFTNSTNFNSMDVSLPQDMLRFTTEDVGEVWPSTLVNPQVEVEPLILSNRFSATSATGDLVNEVFFPI